MTLPQIMNIALRKRYHDETLRLVYPAKEIRIELSSNLKTVIGTFITDDGFEISLGMTKEQLAIFSEAEIVFEKRSAANDGNHFS